MRDGRLLPPLALRLVPLALAVAAAVSIAGCGCRGVVCDACSRVPITVHVTDRATGDPIEDAMVRAFEKDCPRTDFLGPGGYGCDVPVGNYPIFVLAPGYLEMYQSVSLYATDEDSCCSCGPQASTSFSLITEE